MTSLNFLSRSFHSRPSSGRYSIKPFHIYLDLIQSSFILRESLGFGFSHPFCKLIPASQIEFTFLFPSESRTCASDLLMSSRVRDRTLLRCTPRLLCTPLHSIQSIIPIFNEAQSGLGALQSAQF